MKRKIIYIMLIVTLLLGLVACGEHVLKEPEDSLYKNDIQEYIAEFLDDTAKVSIFEKRNSEIENDILTVTCAAMYSGDKGQKMGIFTLSYSKNGNAWRLEKCRVELDDDKEDSTQQEETTKIEETTKAEETAKAEETTEVEETTQSTESTEVSIENDNAVVSENWHDFTFELDGVVYQLPTHYQNFVNNGWKIDGTRSDMSESDMLPGYSRGYIYLSNGAVYFAAEIINLSGHARAVSDCDIGAITVEANDNLGIKIAKGIGCLSTVDEVLNAYGTPSSASTYSEYSTIKYELDSYVSMRFMIYTANTTYNEITLQNFVAQDRDETVPKEERPAYLDTYIAPVELGEDITATRFELDGVLYQLPCPLDVFIDNGWTIRSDSIGTLGAWNDSSGVTLSKGNYNLYISLINLSDFETFTKNCAVSAVTIDGSSFKTAPDDILKIPGGVTLKSVIADVEELYKDFSRYDGSYSTSFTYDSQDYTKKIRYSYSKEYNYVSIDIKNEKWEY